MTFPLIALIAGALGQIAQGRSLQRVFGHGQGFQESYNAMANTQADMQNITARETTRSAREHFGAGLNGGGSTGMSFAHATKSNVDMRHEQFAGTAEGYDSVTDYAAKQGVKGSPFQHQAAADTKIRGNTTSDNIKQGMQEMAETARAQGEANYMESSKEGYNKAQAMLAENEVINNEIDRHHALGRDSGHMYADNLARETAFERKQNELMAKGILATIEKEREQAGNIAAEAAAADPNAQSKALDNMVSSNTAMNVQQQVGVSAGYQAAISTGALNPSTGTFNQGYRSGVSYEAAQGYSNVLATGNQASSANLGNFTSKLSDMGMNAAQVQSIISAPTQGEKLMRMAAATGQANFQGSFQGRSFRISASADGQWNGSFDSSVNVRGGYNVDMGSATAAGGYMAGGVTGMRAVGITQTGWNFATETASNVMTFAPGGGFAKGGARLGLVKTDSRYHMGIGQHRAMMKKREDSTSNMANSTSNGIKEAKVAFPW